MLVFFLFTIYESFLFPRSFFVETQFNPANLNQEQLRIFAGSEIKFGLGELRTHTLCSQLKSYNINLASFGNDLYKENLIGLGFCFSVIEKMAFGIDISVLNYWIKDNYSRFGYSIKLGGIFSNGPVEIGAWANNINIPKFSEIDYIPPSYSLRCDYFATDNLSLGFAVRGVEKDLPFFNFGLLYSPHEIIELGISVNTEPILLEYGLQIYIGDFVVNYFGSNHLQLGLSHLFSLGFIL